MDTKRCQFCSTTSPITSDFEFENLSVQYFMRPNGELIEETVGCNWRNVCTTEVSIENYFLYCPFCGRKFNEDEE